MEVEPAAKDVVAEQSVLLGLLDGAMQTVDRQGILGANVDNSFARSHHVSADDHSLQQRMRVGLDLVPVHVRARIALVRVADHKLAVC